jgi:hypothetical protein
MGQFVKVSSAEEVEKILGANRELRHAIKGASAVVQLEISQCPIGKRKNELLIAYKMIEVLIDEINKREIFFRSNERNLLQSDAKKNL